MQSFYRFPDPGPETEAQKERAAYIGLMLERRRDKRRQRWQTRIDAIKTLFRK